MGIVRSRTAIHDWVHEAGLEPTGETTPTEIAADETVIRVNGRRCWPSAVFDTATGRFLRVRLIPAFSAQLTMEPLRELRAEHRVDQPVFLVDDAPHLRAVPARLDLHIRVERFGYRNAVEHIFDEVKC